MSIHSRDYMRDENRSRRIGGPSSWSVVTRLLVLNVGVFLLNNLIFYSPTRDFLALSLEGLAKLRLWTPVTYQFVHANLWHLLANGIGLFFLGRLLLSLVPPRQVVRIYLLGGLAGGALQLGWNAAFGPDANIVGASASVSAIIFAVATLIPHRSITLLLFFVLPVTLTMRQVALILIAINAVTLFFSFGGAENERVAVMAHFGGMLYGWAHIRFGWHEAGKRSPRAKGRPSSKRRKGRGFGIRVIRDGKEPGGQTEDGSHGDEEDFGKKKPFVTSDVDAILDKINEHGFQSLTAEERRVLEQSSRKLSRRIDRDPR